MSDILLFKKVKNMLKYILAHHSHYFGEYGGWAEGSAQFTLGME